ncbi:MAG: hypothetical protein QME64_09800, partial [bacterium]|nr:hypothetical protein [bacterium]
PPTKVLFFPRYISFIMPFYLLGTAFGVAVVSERLGKKFNGNPQKLRMGFAGLMVLMLLMVSVKPDKEYYQTEKQNWRGAVKYLTAQARDNDIILVGPYNAKWCVLYYVPPEAQSKQVRLIEKCNEVKELKQLCADNSRVWFITAYYRLYEFRKPAYFDWIEQQFEKPTIFPGRTANDSIHVFFYQK